MEHNYYLAHYGVKGMKWKKRRRREIESDRLKRLGIHTSEQLEEYRTVQKMRKSGELRKLGIRTPEQLHAYLLTQKIRKKVNQEIEKKRNVIVKHYSSGDNIVKQFKNFISSAGNNIIKQFKNFIPRAFNNEPGGGGGSSSF